MYSILPIMSMYTRSVTLFDGFIVPEQCSCIFSLMFKSFPYCLQMSGSGEQEERILNLQNDLKTSIVVSGDGKTLETDISLIFISIKLIVQFGKIQCFKNRMIH